MFIYILSVIVTAHWCSDVSGLHQACMDYNVRSDISKQ